MILWSIDCTLDEVSRQINLRSKVLRFSIGGKQDSYQL